MKFAILFLTLLTVLLPSASLQAQSKDLATLVEGNNQFALNLYHQIGQSSGNKFFSPYSISSALGMTYAGAKGQTAQQMANTLHFSMPNERLNPAFGAMIRQIQGTDKKRDFQLVTANSLWASKFGFTLNPNFQRITQTDFHAGVQFVDFLDDPQGARKKINEWVEDKTNDKIKDLLQPSDIQKSTRLVLVNAIYFKASWLEPFPKHLTQPEAFAVPGSSGIKVPMMNSIHYANHVANDDFQLAQLPYKDNEVSMVVILPNKKDGLEAVEKKFTAKLLQDSLAQAKKSQLRISLPKFKMTESLSLGDYLSSMGMKDAFEARVADFSGIEETPSKQNGLYIAKVIHKAFVDVHEEGTEAAAATAVAMRATSAAPEPPVLFKADHPFLFLIRHNATGSILFMGRVDDPRSK